jgi:hypothetical protein
MDSTAHYFSVVMFYELQSSAYFLIVMLIPNLFFLSPAPTVRSIVLVAEKRFWKFAHKYRLESYVQMLLQSFFITKILIVDFKSIKQKTVEYIQKFVCKFPLFRIL